MDVATVLGLVEADAPESWATVRDALTPLRPDALAALADGQDDQDLARLALEMLLWVSLCAHENQAQHISLIFQLDGYVTSELKVVIMEQQALLVELPSSDDDKAAASGADPSDACASVHSPKDVDQGAVDATSCALKARVEALEVQVQEGHARESELETKLRLTKAASFENEDRAIESQRLAQKLEQEALKLRQANHELSVEVKQKDKSISELSDRLDMSSECDRKLASAQAQLAKYRAKIDELSDVEAQLAEELDKRSQHVEKVLALEADVSTIPSLKKQVDDYKQRITAFEIEMRDLKRDLDRRSKAAAEMEAGLQSHKSSAAATQQHALALQHELAAAAAAAAAGPAAAAVSGLAELSPELTERIARLERENKALAARVDLSSAAHAEALVDELDDAKRLAKSFEDKLDATEDLLAIANGRIDSLSGALTALTATEAALRCDFEAAKLDHATARVDLEREMAERESAASSAAAVALARSGASLWLNRRVHESMRGTFEADLFAAKSHIQELSASLACQVSAKESAEALATDLARAGEEKDAAIDAAAEALVAREESLAAAHGAALAAKENELAAFAAEHHLSNSEHAAAVAEKAREVAVVTYQLKEAEEAAGALEAKCRKLTREKKFLSDELQEVHVVGTCSGLLLCWRRQLGAIDARWYDVALTVLPAGITRPARAVAAVTRRRPSRNWRRSSASTATSATSTRRCNCARATVRRRRRRQAGEPRAPRAATSATRWRSTSGGMPSLTTRSASSS